MFVTKILPTRKLRRPPWSAGLVTTVPLPPAATFARAWIGVTAIRRKSTLRVFLKPVALHWPYIAPTIGAILRLTKPKRIYFRHRVKLPQLLAVFPQAQATAPPFPAWDTTKLKRVKRRKRIKRVELGANTYESGIPVSAAIYPSFISNQVKCRDGTHRVCVKPQPVYAASAAPTTTAAVYPSFVPLRAGKRDGDHRKLQTTTPVYTAAISQVIYSSIFFAKASRRKDSRRHLDITAIYAAAAAPITTPALYASLFLNKASFRKSTNRRLIEFADAPVNPIAPAFPFIAIIGSRAKLRRDTTKHRVVILETPEITRLVLFASIIRLQATKTEGVNRTVQTVPPPFYAPPTAVVRFPDHVRLKAHYRQLTSRRMAVVAIAHLFPATPEPPTVKPSRQRTTIQLSRANQIQTIVVLTDRNITVTPKARR